LREYNIELCEVADITDMDAIIFAVPHEEFKNIQIEDVKEMFGTSNNIHSEVMSEVAATSEMEVYKNKNNLVLMDIKGIFNRNEAENAGLLYWRL
jgi:UDP-N-acetyl-D-galactosamine dehydrogenase